MKRLYLLRHAKADWSVAVDHDRLRPLEPRGESDARRLGRFLSDLGQAPDLVLSSDAVRARETARLAGEAGGWRAEQRESEDLYDTPVWKVLRLLRGQHDRHERILVAFHEPTCSETVSELVGATRAGLTTGALVRIDLPELAAWEDIEPAAGVLRWLVTPKLLRVLELSSSEATA